MPGPLPEAPGGIAPDSTDPHGRVRMPGPAAGGRPGARPVQPGRPGRPGVPRGPRKARLTVARVDPWSVLKLSFLLAVAIGVIGVVATGVVWFVINGMGVFDSVTNTVRAVGGEDNTFDVLDYVGFERVLSVSTVIAVANVVILTALATLFAFLYNIGSGLIGGLGVTLTDD